MARARTVDPTITEADKAAMRTNRTVKRMGKLSSHAVATDEALRAARLARGKAAIDAVISGMEKSLSDQTERWTAAEAKLLGKAADISEEQIVEVLFENLPITQEQAVERIARFDVNAMRRLMKVK